MESFNLRGDVQISSWSCDKGDAGVILLLLAYLAFVLYIGPAFMKNRRPYKLRNTLLVYNAVQVVVSAYLAVIVTLGNHLYFIAKVSELLDTVFFVLRKKDNQISFLHLYHHSGIVFAWVVFKNHPSHVCTFLRCVNSAVHVIMYGYYGLAALGPNYASLKWKKYITTMQLIQFVALIIYSIATSYVSECPPSSAHAVFLTGNVIFVLILFVNFYIQNYIAKGKSSAQTDLGCMLPTIDNKED